VSLRLYGAHGTPGSLTGGGTLGASDNEQTYATTKGGHLRGTTGNNRRAQAARRLALVGFVAVAACSDPKREFMEHLQKNKDITKFVLYGNASDPCARVEYRTPFLEESPITAAWMVPGEVCCDPVTKACSLQNP